MRKERSDKGKKRGKYRPRHSKVIDDFFDPGFDLDQLYFLSDDLILSSMADLLLQFNRDIHCVLGPEDLL